MKRAFILGVIIFCFGSLISQCEKFDYQSKFYELEKTYLTFVNNNGIASLYFFLKQENCIDENQTALLFFSDGSKFMFYHNLSFNCKGSFASTLTKEIAENLIKPELTSICISTMSKSHCSTLTKGQKKILTEEINCFLENEILKQ